MARISFETKDRVVIVGNWQEVAEPKGWALLLHMRPATKESWAEFQKRLVKIGVASLAIDSRGHGESVHQQGKILDQEKFTDEEHQAKILDVRAALEWLIAQGAVSERLVVGGASIGANLTVQIMAERPEIGSGFLLSAGLNYRGLQPLQLIRQLQPSQRLFLAAALDDKFDNVRTHHTLVSATKSKTTVREYESGGHGTKLFENHSELVDELIEWTATML